MFTTPEILEIMKINLTPAEIAEGLGLTSEEMVEQLGDYIEENYDEAVACLKMHGIEMGHDIDED